MTHLSAVSILEPERQLGPFSVSVVMAAYNGERFLQEQLDSIAAQTLPPAELVVHDDASTDATWDILEAFRDRAPFPVHLHRSERNLGYREAFFAAALRAQGEWLALCDQDDVWLPHKLETVARYAAPDVALITHSANQVDETLVDLGVRHPDFPKTAVVGRLGLEPMECVFGFAIVVRRSVLRFTSLNNRIHEMDMPDIPQGHDRYLSHVANSLGKTVKIQESLCLYRRHSAALTGPESGGKVYDYGLRARIRTRLRGSAHDLDNLADYADTTRQFYAGRVVEGGPYTHEAAEAEAYYARLSEVFRDRADFYKLTSRPARLAGLARLVRRRTYGRIGAGKGMGAGTLIKDLFNSVV